MSKSPNCLNPQTFRSRVYCLEDLHYELTTVGCNGCSLSDQKGEVGPALYRGNPEAEVMAIGEALGKEEGKQKLPFVGPAGQKGDAIMSYIGLDPNKDCIWVNVVNCRPAAPYGSGRENLPPRVEHIHACRPYFLYCLEEVKPKILVVLGMTAMKAIFPQVVREVGQGIMLNIAGKAFYSIEFKVPVFPMYHPSVLLHSQKDPAKHKFYRQSIADHANLLKEIISNNYKLNTEARY